MKKNILLGTIYILRKQFGVGGACNFAIFTYFQWSIDIQRKAQFEQIFHLKFDATEYCQILCISQHVQTLLLIVFLKGSENCTYAYVWERG